MKKKSNTKLNLAEAERHRLRRQRIKQSALGDFAVDELTFLLAIPEIRAKEILALIEFQRIPSIGIKFAEDLIFLGYYSLGELRGKDGAQLRDSYEKKKGYRIDSCVEDQFRLVVHFAENQDYTKKWWDFTAERKAFREQHGYPADRPRQEWHEVLR